MNKQTILRTSFKSFLLWKNYRYLMEVYYQLIIIIDYNYHIVFHIIYQINKFIKKYR